MNEPSLYFIRHKWSYSISNAIRIILEKKKRQQKQITTIFKTMSLIKSTIAIIHIQWLIQ